MAKSRTIGYRIAHFGDLHLASRDAEFCDALALVDDAVQNGADHLFFSGDILDDADPDLLKSFVRGLRKRNLDNSAMLTVVPGNHDLYPLGWPPTLTDVLRTLGMTAQSNFERFARLTVWSRNGDEADELLPGEEYPFAKVLRDDVVVVGLDSTICDTKLPTNWAAGELSEDAVDAARGFFNEHQNAIHRIVVMHHYPFDDFENACNLFNMHFEKPSARTVRKWLSGTNATLVLCGHIHDNRDRWSANDFRVICTDSANSYTDEEDREGRCYRLIDLHADGHVTVTDQIVESL
jgi:3',5'-cyclic AMP phosphodiesterase CpdA